MSKGIITTEQRQKQVISRLINNNAKLREKVAGLEKENINLRQKLENILLRMAELEKIIFGKKKKKPDDNRDDDNAGANQGGSNGGNSRGKLSYCRPTPAREDVTDIEEHKISNCPDCGTRLTKKQIITRYIEDIKMACLDGLGADGTWAISKTKQVIEQRIAKGYCPNCKTWHSAIPINPKVTRAGPNVRLFVAYAVNILRLSYEQTKNILADLYGFRISDGEITNLLEKTSRKLNPELARIKQRILASKSVHLDETGWLTGRDKNYNWVMAAGDTEEAIFSIGKNRGKGNALDLLADFTGVRVTDCYSGYKNLAGEQAVCWSHLIRKFRDLKNNTNLEEAKKNFANELYGAASALYERVKQIKQTPFSKTERMKSVS